jgi:hypothetical protein
LEDAEGFERFTRSHARANGGRHPVLCRGLCESRFDSGRRGLLPASLAPRIPARVRSMEQRTTALERAFQLARSGRVAGLTDIITSLNREGYSANQIEGRLLKRQLADLIKTARKGSMDSAPP